MFIKDSKCIREKKFQITLYVFRNGNQKKVYGTIEFDISPFFNIPNVQHVKYEIQTPNEIQPSISLSIQLIPTGKSPSRDTSGDLDLSFINESNLFGSEKLIERDVSETVSDDEIEKIQSLFKTKKTNDESTIQLSSFISNPPPRNKSKNSIDHRPPLPKHKQTDSNQLSSFLSPHPKRKLSNPIFNITPPSLMDGTSVQKDKDNANQSGKIIRPFAKPPSKSDSDLLISIHSKSSFEELEQKEKAQTEGQTLLINILSKQWPTDSIYDDWPIPLAVVLFSGLISSKIFSPFIFDSTLFEFTINDFVNRYSQSTIIENVNEMNKLFTTLCLISFLRAEPGLELSRVLYATKNLESLSKSQLKSIVNEKSSVIIEPISFFLTHSQINSPQEIVQMTLNQFKTVENQIHPLLKEMIMKCIIRKLDEKITKFLVGQKNFLSFNNAVLWNTFLTQLSEKTDYQLPLFRESVAVLMMGPTICSDPGSVQEIAPDLPHSIIANLLENEIVDNMIILEKNNISSFRKHFNLSDTLNIHNAYQTNYLDELIEEIISNFNVERKESHFDQAIFELFPHLKKFINQNE